MLLGEHAVATHQARLAHAHSRTDVDHAGARVARNVTAKHLLVQLHLLAPDPLGLAELLRIDQQEWLAVGIREFGDVQMNDSFERVHMHAGCRTRQRVPVGDRLLQERANLRARQCARDGGVHAPEPKHRRRVLGDARIAQCEVCPRPGCDVGIARCVDDNPRRDRRAPALVLDDHRGHARAVGQRLDRTRMEHDPHAVRGHHLVGDQLQARRFVRNSEDASVALWRQHRVACGEPILEVQVEASDDPREPVVIDDHVGAAKTPEGDQRQRAAEASPRLDQHRSRAAARRRAGRRDPRCAAAHYEDVRLGDYRNLALGFDDRSSHRDALLVDRCAQGSMSTAPREIGCTVRA